MQLGPRPTPFSRIAGRSIHLAEHLFDSGHTVAGHRSGQEVPYKRVQRRLMLLRVWIPVRTVGTVMALRGR